jgi:hypothetical protein
VLIEFMQDLMNTPELGGEPNAPYFAALERSQSKTVGDHGERLDHSHCT